MSVKASDNKPSGPQLKLNERQNGNDPATAKIVADAYRRFENELTRFVIHSFNMDSSDAQDLVHTAFEKFATYKELESVENPRAFLYRLVNNIATNNFRHGLVHTRYATQLQESSENIEANDEANPERLTQNRQTLNLIAEIIMEMPLRRREIVMLHRFEHLSYAEIGRRLKITEAAVRKHIKKALEEIVQGLKKRSGN